MVALCVSAFFLGSMTETFADKGGKGGGKGGKGRLRKKGSLTKVERRMMIRSQIINMTKKTISMTRNMIRRTSMMTSVIFTRGRGKMVFLQVCKRK